MSTGQYNSGTIALADGRSHELQLDSVGNLKVTISPSGSGINAQSMNTDAQAAAINGLRSASFGYVLNGTTWDREVKPNATSRIVSAAASVNATSAKASAGNVHKVTGLNVAAAIRFIKFYNKASAPTVGTDTPVWTEAIPASSKFEINFGDKPLYFATGIAYAMTVNGADADATALTAGDIVGFNVAYS